MLTTLQWIQYGVKTIRLIYKYFAAVTHCTSWVLLVFRETNIIISSSFFFLNFYGLLSDLLELKTNFDKINPLDIWQNCSDEGTSLR
jgi:hypothetical protein